MPYGIVSMAFFSWLNARSSKARVERPAPADVAARDVIPAPDETTAYEATAFESKARNGSHSAMHPLTAGITKANTGIDGISWNILGQTYVPKEVCETSFSWHATFPPGTFVPPHIHPTQDEFIYLFEGRLDLVLDGKDFVATAGDFIRLPMGIPHGIFNKSDQTVKCFFWVSPTRRLYDLFWAIHQMKEQAPDAVVALAAKHEVVFLPPPPEA